MFSIAAQLEVRLGALEVLVPQYKSSYVKGLKPEPISMSVVWLREVGAPHGAKPIAWVLSRSLRSPALKMRGWLSDTMNAAD